MLIIYILTNPSMPDTIKIGVTNNLKKRMKELNNTSVPLPFERFYAVEVDDDASAKIIEKKIHKGLNDYRVNENREFFKIKPELAKCFLELLEIMGARNVTPTKDFFERPQDQQTLDNPRIDFMKDVVVEAKGTASIIDKDGILQASKNSTQPQELPSSLSPMPAPSSSRNNGSELSDEICETLREKEAWEKENPYFRILGHSQNNKNESIVHILDRRFHTHETKKRDNLTIGRVLLGLAPDQYWKKMAGMDMDDGYQKRPQKIPYEKLGSALISLVAQYGHFNETEKIRGSGVWIDDGRVVLNTGADIVCDKQRITYHKFKDTNFFYERESSKTSINLSNPLTQSEAKEFLSICKSFLWRNNSDGSLMAGWCVASLICGILSWRPHIWLTGEARTGKSTILTIIEEVLGRNALKATGSSTEAGIRKELKNHAIPVLFEEFDDKDGIYDRQKLTRILRYFYLSSSNTGASTINYNDKFIARSCAFFSGIRVPSKENLDRSRISVLELASMQETEMESKDRKEHWEELSAKISRVIKDNTKGMFGERFLAFVLLHIEVFMENERVINKAIAQTMKARYADQMSPMIAGAALLNDCRKPITEEQFLSEYNKTDFEEHEESAYDSDHHSTLYRLLGLRIQPEGVSQSYSLHYLLGIATSQDKGIWKGEDRRLHKDFAIKVLADYGIIYKKEFKLKGERYKDIVIFANSSPTRAKVLNSDKGSLFDNFILAAKKMPYAILTEPRNFNNFVRQRGVGIPLSIATQSPVKS